MYTVTVYQVAASARKFRNQPVEIGASADACVVGTPKYERAVALPADGQQIRYPLQPGVGVLVAGANSDSIRLSAADGAAGHR